mmetsp:Transcript_29334/g.79415  ORF Transcript_29334/g.79415 Transcript_29334/m.79415 type:complete len:206 (+) Transcript_29334:910-1527(+)
MAAGMPTTRVTATATTPMETTVPGRLPYRPWTPRSQPPVKKPSPSCFRITTKARPSPDPFTTIFPLFPLFLPRVVSPRPRLRSSRVLKLGTVPILPTCGTPWSAPARGSTSRFAARQPILMPVYPYIRDRRSRSPVALCRASPGVPRVFAIPTGWPRKGQPTTFESTAVRRPKPVPSTSFWKPSRTTLPIYARVATATPNSTRHA